MSKSDNEKIVNSAVKKSIIRLLPFLALMYVMAYLDRANIGFAKEAFQVDTGLSNAAYAFGAGVFFIGYALFEVPSNIFLYKVGARLWLSRIMVTWGLISAAMMFAHDEKTFIILRFLLGASEAGFMPGVMLYLTFWFPLNIRAKVAGYFWFGPPIAFILGGAAAASGIALINSLGNLGGFVAPNIRVWAENAFDSNIAGLYLLGGIAIIGAIMLAGIFRIGIRRDLNGPAPEKSHATDTPDSTTTATSASVE